MMDEIKKFAVEEILNNPVNLGLVIILGYFTFQTFFQPKPKPNVPREPKVIELRDFTPLELSKYDGRNGSEIYLAIAGKVFDVSSKPDFYGPGSMYENFSGRDASRGMAKHSFDKEMIQDLDKPIDDLRDLTDEERSSLKEWEEFFTSKYSIVGTLKSQKINFQILLIAAMIISLLGLYSTIGLKTKTMLDACPLLSPKTSQSELITANRKQLQNYLLKINASFILIPASVEVLRDDSDMELPGWRNPSNIFYVLGKYDIPGSFVLISPSKMNVSIVLPEQTEREIVFSGAVFNRTELIINHHLDQVLDLKNLDGFVGKTVLYSPSKKFQHQNTISGTNVTVAYSSQVEQAFIESRFIKTKPELELLSYASHVASLAHSETQKAIETWTYVSESKLAAYFAFVSTICGAYLQAYNPIVGAGRHGAVLHFPTGNTPDGGSLQIPKKDLILIDAAGAYIGYASDLTRTYSITPSSHKKLLTEIVLEAQLAGINTYKVGNKWSKVVDKTLEKLTHGMHKHGFLVAENVKDLINAGVISVFMPHGVGHPVGLEVHDPYPASVATMETESPHSKGLRDEYPLKLKFDYVLRPGHVHTVEPGIYFIPYMLERAKTGVFGKKITEMINWKKVKEFENIGGVRIEDCLAIGLDGVSRIITKH